MSKEKIFEKIIAISIGLAIFGIMKKGNKGGKRAGSGRKPVDNPKVQVTVYLEQTHIDQFGGLTEIKTAICDFVRNWEIVEIAKKKPETEVKFSRASHKKARKAVISHITDKVAEVALQDATAPNKEVKPITDPKPATNYTVDTRPKMPSGLNLMQQIEWREKNGG